MKLVWRKEQSFADGLGRYLNCVRDCAGNMVKAFGALFEDGVGEQYEQLVEQVHDAESHADDLRRELEFKLYEGAFLPHSRGDFLGLLESLDKMPNSMEALVRDIAIMEVSIPAPFVPEVKALVDKCVEAVLETCVSAELLFSDLNQALERAKNVDHLESEADEIEVRILHHIFRSNLELAQKLVLKDIIRHLAGVADRAENASDRIEIVSIKRRA